MGLMRYSFCMLFFTMAFSQVKKYNAIKRGDDDLKKIINDPSFKIDFKKLDSLKKGSEKKFRVSGKVNLVYNSTSVLTLWVRGQDDTSTFGVNGIVNINFSSGNKLWDTRGIFGYGFTKSAKLNFPKKTNDILDVNTSFSLRLEDKCALEPHIDAKTMEIHHTKHHNAYTKNLNNSISGTHLEGKSIEDILRNLDMSNVAVRNNGGGFYNHNLFWEILSPEKSAPSPDLSSAINIAFGNLETFKEAFSKVATTRFGSGWAWLCVHKGGKVEVCSSANQDNPIMPNVGCGGTPILGLDVWEHAYYLNYQNRRPDYISAFFNIINWDKVSNFYSKNK
ncbi:superoxide dismutase [Elysia marginata]|uniref:superoxide dismutase n=1 Tax=Elysia marginata TaxID=1093978 RepID=A0AAV4G606_9GAST|nr:superoxide dismutase [Elysia marginata]